MQVLIFVLWRKVDFNQNETKIDHDFAEIWSGQEQFENSSKLYLTTANKETTTEFEQHIYN